MISPSTPRATSSRASPSASPIDEEMPGWVEDIRNCRSFEELPAAAQAYVARVEELSGSRISVIGVGPGRDENVVRHDLLG